MPVVLPCLYRWFLAYLWGIETLHTDDHRRSDQEVFSVPMRNWNSCIWKAVVEKYPVFSVPMRNWNILRWTEPALNPTVFSVPMRNWNSQKLVYKPPGTPVFSVPMRNWNTDIPRDGAGNPRFQRTYEELKPFDTARQACEAKGFQRTYEELKPVFVNPGHCVLLVFSAYLWGIETTRWPTSPPTRRGFSAYLWGIETVL